MVVAYIDNMESKIINIYFDQNAYPFKDKKRSVIYPITGSAFVGFSATQKIRFFVDRIGGVLDTTWVATTKLPNGQLIYELLQTTDYDDEIGEYFVELTLTQPYSALKGDISIGLSGYQGGVEVQEDEDTGIYTIVGTPTIQTSAVIKFNINYAPSTLPKQTLGFTDLQQILAYLSKFMQQDESIVVIENTSVDLSGFEDGQVFYCKLDQLIYRLDSGNLVVDKDGYVPYTGATKNVDLGNHTITALRFISGDGSETTYRERNLLYITHGAYSNTYIFRVKNANTNDYVATEDYVDNNIYEMASASVVLSDSDYAYLLKNNVRIHYGDLFYEKAKETASQVIFYSVDYQRTTTGGSTGYTTRTTKKITLTKSSQQLDAADINDLSYNKEQTDKNFAHSLSLQLNTTNYKLSVYLYDKEGNALSSQTIDLPLESIVVSATYYDSYTYGGTTYQKVIVIVLATTDVPTIIPVGDLVDGLATTTQLTNGLALKVNKSDIADNLTTNDATKVLSAKQGYELNNAVVHNTGNETITGNKTFTGSTSFKYNIDFVSPDGTKSGAFRLADNGNFIWRVGNASKFMYDYANGNFSSWVDIVGNGNNAQSLGNASHYWKDLYLKGKWKDGTNEKSLQDLLDENASLQYQLNQLKEEFYETTIDIQSYEYQYLLTDTIPLLINSKNVVESIGMDCVNVKGNSYVYNQLMVDGNMEDDTKWARNRCEISLSNNVMTINVNENASSSFIRTNVENQLFPNGHKMFYKFTAYNNVGDKSCRIAFGTTLDEGNSNTITIGTTKTDFSGIITLTNNRTLIRLYVPYSIDYLYYVSNFQVFDLTQLGIDSVSTTEQAIAELMKLGINPYEYNAYNEGKIVNSKPTKLVVGGFNLWDEEWELGYFDLTTGQPVSNNAISRSKNYIKVLPNNTFYYKSNGANHTVLYYNKNKNYISYASFGTSDSSLSIPANAYFMKFAYVGTTYNHDICINISNATLNGTYKPYIAPTEYALDLPILRSAETVQDDKEKVRIAYVSLDGTVMTGWRLAGTYGTSTRFECTAIVGALDGKIISNQFKRGNVGVADREGIILHGTTGMLNVQIATSKLNTADVDGLASYFAQHNLEINYEKETPTDQPTITLPENIAIQKGGTITSEYDSTDNAPSDFDFELGTSNIQ